MPLSLSPPPLLPLSPPTLSLSPAPLSLSLADSSLPPLLYLVSPITFTNTTLWWAQHCLMLSIVSGVFLSFQCWKYFSWKTKGTWLDFSHDTTLSVVVNHHCGHTSSVRVPTNPDQPTLQTLMYKSLASQLYKSNPFRSPGRKSTLRPQAVLLNLHKLLGTRFPTPTHHIDRCPSTFLYILRIRILDFPIYTTHKNPRLRYQLSQIPM